jgi:N-acetylglucosamine-6-sulfatase
MIVLDDADGESMDLGLQQTKALVAGQGVTLPNFITTTPLCGPSRASMLRGQYAHNTRIKSNADSAKFFGVAYNKQTKRVVSQNTIERDTIATRLKAAGYRTGHFGKYLNAWGSANITGPKPPPPPGWDRFVATVIHGDTPTTYTQYRLLEGNAGQPATKITDYGPESNPAIVYEPRMVTQKAISFIRSTPANKPLFAMIHMRPPHSPATPHPSKANAPLPPSVPPFVNSPAYDEEPVPPIKDGLTSIGLYPFTDEWKAYADNMKAARYRSMLYVDQLIVQVIDELQAAGRLDNTYVFVLSDNGYHEGEHSFAAGKATAYKEVLSPPMWVRGPKVAPNRVDARLAGVHDLAPTLLTLAGEKVPSWMDGRHLRPLLNGNSAVSWRTAILGRNWELFNWMAVQTDDKWKLVLWPNDGYGELYNLAADPFERTNLADQPGQESSIGTLLARLRTLKSCQGAIQCRAAEGP